jgi:hypothetical protein
MKKCASYTHSPSKSLLKTPLLPYQKLTTPSEYANIRILTDVRPPSLPTPIPLTPLSTAQLPPRRRPRPPRPRRHRHAHHKPLLPPILPPSNQPNSPIPLPRRPLRRKGRIPTIPEHTHYNNASRPRTSRRQERGRGEI